MAPSLGIFYGSQTGCAESIAKRIYDDALEKDIDATFAPLNDLQNSELLQPSATPQHIVIVCATTGNGDPPDNCAKFWRFIKRRTQPKDMLTSVAFTVLGLGDTNYDKFCYMGKSLDKRMSELGAHRFFEMCAADEAMGLEDQVEPWLEGLWIAFAKSTGAHVTGDGNETATSSDDDDATATGEENKIDETTEPPAPVYLQSSLATYETFFGPITTPTETPEDVPRLQSSLYSTRILDATEATAAVATKPEAPVLVDGDYSATHPFEATLRTAKYLTKSHSDRKVLYVELDTTGSNITFSPGDSIGIKCPNRIADVDALLQRLELDGDAIVCVEPAVATGGAAGARRATPKAKSSNTSRFPSPCKLRDVLLHHVDLRISPKKAALRALAVYCTDEKEKSRLLVLSSKSGADKYTRFVSDQQLTFVELLHLFPSCAPPLDHLLSLLPQLMPRFYSIATSPLAHANTIGIAFTIVEDLVGPHQAIRRRGLCTNWLHDIAQPLLVSTPDKRSSSLEESIKVPLFLRATRDFLLPASHEYPLILIGPGTGVAPFMGFLQHRHLQVASRMEVASQVCSGSWRGGLDLDLEEDDEFATCPAQAVESKGIYLFFGCRRRTDDWLFEDEMKSYVDNGTLRGLFTAFSREQEHKQYVQHEIRKQGELVAELLLQSGGYVYVCGDGTQMAKDVHEALREVLEQHGKLSREQADEQLAALAARQRYVRDIW